MKKIVALILVIITLSSCTVQENMSPAAFVERLEEADDSVAADTENAFLAKGEYICRLSYGDADGFLLKISADSHSYTSKICLVYSGSDGQEDFVGCCKSITGIYALSEDVDTVASELFGKKEGFVFYESKKYLYSFCMSEESTFFSVENKILSQATTPELTLR